MWWQINSQEFEQNSPTWIERLNTEKQDSPNRIEKQNTEIQNATDPSTTKQMFTQVVKTNVGLIEEIMTENKTSLR